MGSAGNRTENPPLLCAAAGFTELSQLVAGGGNLGKSLADETDDFDVAGGGGGGGGGDGREELGHDDGAMDGSEGGGAFHEEVVRVLLAWGAAINQPGRGGRT